MNTLIAPEIIAVGRLAELEAVIDRGMDTYYEVGSAFKEIIDGKMWEPQYRDFEDFCFRRFGFHKRMGYYFVTASNVLRDVQRVVQISAFELKFSHSVEMVKLAAPQRVEMAREVVENNLTVYQTRERVAQMLAAEKRRPAKVPLRPRRGTALIRTLADLRLECADLLIVSTHSDPPIMTEIGQYLRPGCSFLVPFQVPMMLLTADPGIQMLGILGVQRAERADQGPVIVEQDLFGWFSRGEYAGGRCSNRLTSLADVVQVVSFGGDTIVELNPISCAVLHATVLCDRHYIGINPAAAVADAIRVYEQDG